jgi:hypothetical protein
MRVKAQAKIVIWCYCSDSKLRLRHQVKTKNSIQIFRKMILKKLWQYIRNNKTSIEGMNMNRKTKMFGVNTSSVVLNNTDLVSWRFKNSLALDRRLLQTEASEHDGELAVNASLYNWLAVSCRESVIKISTYGECELLQCGLTAAAAAAAAAVSVS